MRASSLRAGEADQQQGAVAQAWQVVADRRDDLAQDGDPGGELGPRPVARFARGTVQPGEGLAVEFPSTFQSVPLAVSVNGVRQQGRGLSARFGLVVRVGRPVHRRH